jgi:ribosomal protein L12E/L44/L45/RPP1/RPP2
VAVFSPAQIQPFIKEDQSAIQFIHQVMTERGGVIEGEYDGYGEVIIEDDTLPQSTRLLRINGIWRSLPIRSFMILAASELMSLEKNAMDYAFKSDDNGRTSAVIATVYCKRCWDEIQSNTTTASILAAAAAADKEASRGTKRKTESADIEEEKEDEEEEGSSDSSSSTGSSDDSSDEKDTRNNKKTGAHSSKRSKKDPLDLVLQAFLSYKQSQSSNTK